MIKSILAAAALIGFSGMVYAGETTPQGSGSEAFTGVAARSGTYKRPLLDVGGKRYELKASEKADATVAGTLAKFSKGDTGSYVVKGVKATVNNRDGILVDSITPAASGKDPGDGDAKPSDAPNSKPAADSGQQRKYKSFDYDDKAGKQVRLTIPEGLATVRGILVVGPGAGGDSREFYQEAWYGEFMYLHDFAFIGTKGFDSHVESLRAMQNAIKQVAKDSRHPELVNAPFVATGFSSGGGFASRLLVEVPDRVIASVPVCARLNFTGVTPTAAHLGTPACIISGEFETAFPKAVEPVLAACRPKGALFGWMTVPGGGHSRMGQEVLAMPLLDAAVRLRYPAGADVRKGPIKLKTLDPKSGWIADNTTWKSGLTSIVPAKDVKGDIKKSSWLPNEDIAFIYRAYSTYDRPLKITSPRTFRIKDNGLGTIQTWDPGSDVTIVVDDSAFAGWKKLEFCDGAHRLGEITKGKPEFTAKKLASGFHVFSVLGTGAKGNVRPSDPVLVVVRKLAK